MIWIFTRQTLLWWTALIAEENTFNVQVHLPALYFVCIIWYPFTTHVVVIISLLFRVASLGYFVLGNVSQEKPIRIQKVFVCGLHANRFFCVSEFVFKITIKMALSVTTTKVSTGNKRTLHSMYDQRFYVTNISRLQHSPSPWWRWIFYQLMYILYATEKHNIGVTIWLTN